ncbi:fork-head transcriptional regulator 2 [Diutina catenulata]
MEKVVPRKRGIGELEPSGSPAHGSDMPHFDDPADMINAVISTLQIPEEHTNVAATYANDKNQATEVQAYAKIAGQDWTVYVKTLSVVIGRNTEGNQPQTGVDIDLGPAKVVSRQHASINYNLDLRCWELKVYGRNGARVDGQKLTPGQAGSTPLHSGAILDIGGTQMMFILPDSPPTIVPSMLNKSLAKYKENSAKGTYRDPAVANGYYQGAHNLKPFQMFDKSALGTPSAITTTAAVSATSLQNNLDQDLSKEESKDIKPPYSYATMITQAILSNEDGVLSLSEIYNWISSHYAYYKYSKTGWQNSIRHNLSLNKAFEKVPRRPNEPGKGMKWQISEAYKSDFLNQIREGPVNKPRRGSSVSRQLHLHLAMHKQLPESGKYYNKPADNISAPNHNPQQYSTQPGQPQIHQQQMHQGTGQPQPPHQQYAMGGIGQAYQFPPPTFPQQQQQPMPQGTPPYHFPPGGHQRTSSLPKISPQQPVMGQYNPGFVPGHQPQYSGSFAPHHQSSGSFGGIASGYSFPPNTVYPQSGQAPPGAQGPGLSSPLRQMAELSGSGNTPKLPKVGGGSQGNHFSLPPPHNGNNSNAPSSAAPVATKESNQSAHSTSGSSNSSSANNTTANTTAAALPTDIANMAGFTSPKKVAPLEAFTPERGSKVGNKDGAGITKSSLAPPNQSSPAFWNFVQFSTPNGQTPLRKNCDDVDQTSPTISRKMKEYTQKEGSASPLKSKVSEEKAES